MLNFWTILEAAVGLVERLVNKPKPTSDVAEKAKEKWERERPKR